MFGTGVLARFPRLAKAANKFVKHIYRMRYGGHREAIGGEWDLMGPAQFAFMKSVGLKPHHSLLDLGCGSLRGGVRFIAYLDKGRYYGIDKESSLIAAARDIEIPRYHLQDKAANLLVIDDFDISQIGVQFDFMFAHSVFSHLSAKQIENCLDRLLPWLKSGGAFYVDFKLGDSVKDTGPHKSRRDELHKAWYTVAFFEDLASRKGYTMEYIGDWPNHTNDKMLKFGRLDATIDGGKRAETPTVSA